MRAAVRELSVKVREPWPPLRGGTRGKLAQQSVGEPGTPAGQCGLCRVPRAGRERGGDPGLAVRGPCRGCSADQELVSGRSTATARATAVLTAPTLLHSRDEPRAAPSVQWGAHPQMAESREEVSHTHGQGMAQRRTRVSSSGAQSVGPTLAWSE